MRIETHGCVPACPCVPLKLLPIAQNPEAGATKPRSKNRTASAIRESRFLLKELSESRAPEPADRVGRRSNPQRNDQAPWHQLYRRLSYRRGAMQCTREG